MPKTVGIRDVSPLHQDSYAIHHYGGFSLIHIMLFFQPGAGKDF